MSDDHTLARQAFEALKAGDIHTALNKLERFLEGVPEKSEQEKINEAEFLVRQDYRKDIDNQAKDLKKRWEAGEFDGDRDSFMQAIDEDVDGSQRVIYTSQAREAVMFSQNEDAAFDELGADGLDFSSGIPWSQIAYFAFRRDIIDELEQLDIDVNADPPCEGDIKCTECDEWSQGTGTVCDSCKPEESSEEESDGEEETG